MCVWQCLPQTAGAVRLVVDTDMTCEDTRRSIITPYVVSSPEWLVARQLEAHSRRTRLLFFRGHMPNPGDDPHLVREAAIRAFHNDSRVLVRPANSHVSAAAAAEAASGFANASYSAHDAYLEQLRTSIFCLAPRGDTSSSKRLYEALAAGCIPVLVSDGLQVCALHAHAICARSHCNRTHAIRHGRGTLAMHCAFK